MLDLNAANIFLLGFVSGLSVLSVSSYRHASGHLVRFLLFACGSLVIIHYIAIFLLSEGLILKPSFGLAILWYGTLIGLTLPCTFALDQLIRHPAMNPQKLLKWYSPFLIAYLVILYCAPSDITPNSSGYLTFHLVAPWQWGLTMISVIFALIFIFVCLKMLKIIQTSAVKRALIGLIAGQAYMATTMLLQSTQTSTLSPNLTAECFMLLALWYAFETSKEHSA